MEKWKGFWLWVQEDIQKQYADDLATWQESSIEEFLRHFENAVRDSIKDDEELARNCGIEEGANPKHWRSVVPGTFRRLFLSKESSGQPHTRNSFAIYLGYRSAEDYLRNRNKATKPEVNEKATQRVPTKEEKENQPISVVIELPDADYTKEDLIEEWMIYEAAFLWHGKEPPGIQAHFVQMTRDIERTKAFLHGAIEQGLLKAKELRYPNGFTRYVTRDALEEFIQVNDIERPAFLNKKTRSQ